MGGGVADTGIGSDGMGMDAGWEATRKMKTWGRSVESER